MRRLLTIIAMLISVATLAQSPKGINRKILGFELGQSITPVQIAEKLQVGIGELSLTSEDKDFKIYCVPHNMVFAKESWNYLGFVLYKGKLASLLISDTMHHNFDNANIKYKSSVELYNQKYTDYIIEESTIDTDLNKSTFWTDSITGVTIELLLNTRNKEIRIRYIDHKLQEQYNNMVMDSI